MTSKTSLVGKLVEVTEAVGKIRKTGYNSHQKYEYMTEKDLVDAIKAELAARKILVTTSVLKTEFKGDLCLVETEHTFHDAESGETLKVQGSGTGYDKTDKAVFKAQTGAFKYFLMKNFLISSDDDPENDGVVKKDEPKANPYQNKNVDSRPVSGPSKAPTAPQAAKPVAPITPAPKAAVPAQKPTFPSPVKKDEVKKPAFSSTFKKATKTEAVTDMGDTDF